MKDKIWELFDSIKSLIQDIEDVSYPINESTVIPLIENLDKFKKEIHQHYLPSIKRDGLERSITIVRETLLRIIPNLKDYNKMVSIKRKIKGWIDPLRHALSDIHYFLSGYPIDHWDEWGNECF